MLRLHRFSLGVLLATLGVILWGAFVRASGSGAGCGAHWPVCNGELVPRSPSVETLIELTHRLTSGAAFLAVVALVVASLRVLPRRHPGRAAAGWSLVFMVTEALIGAGLVLLEYVADDTRPARGAWMAVHLLNTFLLLAALTSSAWHTRPTSAELAALPAVGTRAGRLGLAFWAALVGMGVLGMSGAVAALGDTLFPASSLSAGLAQDFSSGAHLLVRLRVLHPALAVAVGAGLLALASAAVRARPSPDVRRAAGWLVTAVCVQLGVGVVNVVLLAPTWMQLLHLLLADAVWMALWVLRLEARAPRALPAAATDAQPQAPALPGAGTVHG